MPRSPTQRRVWATEPYSYIVPSDGDNWAAFVLMGGHYVLWLIEPREIALRAAKKQGNRLKRLEASRANVPAH